jgi:hypothetical protein
MDLFPSLTAAINSSDIFSDLRTVLDRIETEGNFSMLATLEEIPGTMAVPTNAVSWAVCIVCCTLMHVGVYAFVHLCMVAVWWQYIV